jgi:hypothetical protein
MIADRRTSMLEKPVASRRISRRAMLAATAAIANYAHLEMAGSLGTPHGPNGRAALALMRLGVG